MEGHDGQVRELVERQARAWERNDADLLLGDWLPDGVLSAPGAVVPAAGLREELASFHAAHTHLVVEIRSVLAAPDGTRAAVEWDWNVTDAGGVRTVTRDAIVIDLEQGMIRSWREYFDTAGAQRVEEPADAEPGLSPFTLLFDDAGQDGASLPEDLRRIYGGDWRVPAPVLRPYVYVNFALSHDGKVSFSIPGHSSGADVSGFNAHDQWLMGLLRARADAVLAGDSTLRIEPEHVWTAQYIYPPAAAAFAALRRAEGRAPVPLNVILSLTGDLPDAEVLRHPEVHLVVATTRAGAERARSLRHAGRLDVLDLGEQVADPAELVATLGERYGVRNLLCEGGPRVYASMLAADQVDEEFLTYCPTVIGNPGDGRRPSLVEGHGFAPADAPRMRPVSLRRAGDHLFLRSRRDRS